MPFANCWLQEAAERIDSGAFRLLSLDIFDTTVWRSYPTPTDLFFRLGAEAVERGWLYPSSPPEVLAAVRSDCEAEARRRKGWTSEVTLDEIYAEFPPGVLRGVRPMSVKELELELERNATFPHPEVVALIGMARRRGLQVAFVTDTYFPEWHLRAILPVTADYLISSCSYGLSKVEGLHRALIAASAVKPNQIFHLGDNLQADVHAPAKLGISTLWFPKFSPPWDTAILSELPVTRSERAELFYRGGDYGLTSLRSMALNSHGNLLDGHQAWGAAVLGPAMAAFCEWIIERSQKENLPVALFLMREGRILREMIHCIDPHFPAVELYISRYAAIWASIFSGTVEELSAFFARPTPTPAAQLLAPLHITPEQVGVPADHVIESEQGEKLAQQVHDRRDLRSKAVAASQQVRTRLLRHLNQVLPDLPPRLGIVDLGYGGTIQRCLQRIFDHSGVPVQTHGLYFITNSSIRKVHESGAPAEGYLADRGHPVTMAHPFCRSPEVFEQSLMCDCGSTVGYDECGAPVCDRLHVPREQFEAIRKVQKGALDFLHLWAKHRPRLDDVSELLKPFVTSLLIRAITAPTDTEIEAFGAWRHDENFGSQVTRKLSECTLPPIYLRHLSAKQLAGLRSQEIYWVFALAHRLGQPLGEAVRALFLRKAPAEAFQSALPPVELTLLWDDGSLHEMSSKLTLSQSGLSWERYSLRLNGSSVRRLGFRASRQTTPVVFDGVNIYYKDSRGSEKTLSFGAGALLDPEGKPLPPGTPLSTDVPSFLNLNGDTPPCGTLTLDLFLSVAPGLQSPAEIQSFEFQNLKQSAAEFPM